MTYGNVIQFVFYVHLHAGSNLTRLSQSDQAESILTDNLTGTMIILLQHD